MTNHSFVNIKKLQIWEEYNIHFSRQSLPVARSTTGESIKILPVQHYQGGTREGWKEKEECYSVCILGDRWSKGGAPTALRNWKTNWTKCPKTEGGGRPQETGDLLPSKRKCCLTNEDGLKSWVLFRNNLCENYKRIPPYSIEARNNLKHIEVLRLKT